MQLHSPGVVVRSIATNFFTFLSKCYGNAGFWGRKTGGRSKHRCLRLDKNQLPVALNRSREVAWLVGMFLVEFRFRGSKYCRKPTSRKDYSVSHAPKSVKRTFGLDGPQSDAPAWWGHATSKSRNLAWIIALAVGVFAFLVFNWLMRDQIASPSLVATIIATLSALNVVQAYERSTIQGGSNVSEKK